MTKSFDIKLGGETYTFGARGGLQLGKAPLEQGGRPAVATIIMDSFHHGPGQLVGRDPEQYLRGTRVDTTRKGQVLPSGVTTLVLDSADVVFDGIHGAALCILDAKVFIITPAKVYKVTFTGDVASAAAVHTMGAGTWLTGSWARWRGQVVFGVEKAPAIPLGGDSSVRYAEADLLIYNIAADAFHLNAQNASGTAEAAGATSLTDTQATWVPDEHVGAVVTCDTKTMTITSNTGTVVTGSAWAGGTPTPGAYTIVHTAKAWEKLSYISSAKGSLWWIQNRGRYAAPLLYWTDDTETYFGDHADAARVYGPFYIEQGGYCTWLHMAGPHILLFKRDGSIVGVDESRIWTTYTGERGAIADDLFGHGLIEYQGTLVAPSEDGGLAFNPANLGLNSIEPSRIQSYQALADSHFMGRISAVAARNDELYAFGRTTDGAALYVGSKRADEPFHYASDYGQYASDTPVPPTPGGNPFMLRNSVGGSMVRATVGADEDILRRQTVTTVLNEVPLAAGIYHRTEGGRDDYYAFTVHRKPADNKWKLYKIDLASPGWDVAPKVAGSGQLITSRLYAPGGLAGLTMVPLQLRGYAAVTEGTGSLVLSLGVEELAPSVVGNTLVTGGFALQMPLGLSGLAGRYFTAWISFPADSGFRLGLPLFLDVLYSPLSGPNNDMIILNVTLGDVADNLGQTTLHESAHAEWERLLALQGSAVALEFRWGATWQVWVEDVSIQQSELDAEASVLPGQYVASVQCRRLS